MRPSEALSLHRTQIREKLLGLDADVLRPNRLPASLREQVPHEVFRRLCNAPTPATYWEDRIADEYPKGVPMTSAALPSGTKTPNDLFGPGE